jgi:hypothetical protein
MKRFIAAVAALGLALSLASAPAAVAAPAVPTPGPNQVVNPSGKIVDKLPPLVNVPANKGLNAAGKAGPVKGKPSLKAKLGGVSALLACDGVSGPACYLYNGGRQFDFTPNYGVSSTVTHGGHSGALNGATDYHTLVETAVQSDDSNQIIEVGVIQSPSVNKNPPGSSTGWYGPRLFVGAWVNDVFQGYNGGGFVPVSGTSVVPGVTNLPANTAYVQHIWYSTDQDMWWIGFGTEWIGYFPGSMWTGATPSVTFNRNELTQIFWEMASTELKPCSDLGNGDIPTATLGSKVENIAFRGVTNGAITAGVNFSTFRQGVPGPDANVSSPYANTYSLGPAGAQRGYKGGGPMHNAAGTGVGVKGNPC